MVCGRLVGWLVGRSAGVLTHTEDDRLTHLPIARMVSVVVVVVVVVVIVENDERTLPCKLIYSLSLVGHTVQWYGVWCVCDLFSIQLATTTTLVYV